MIIREGLATVYSSSELISGGPGTRGAAFYNSEQLLNRDVTLALMSILKPRRYLDGFGGTGIRSIRATLELKAESVVSEVNRKSCEIIEQNIMSNEADVDLVRGRFEGVVSSQVFDFIDVDPYGSVVPYIDVSLNYVKNGGYIGFTSTDLTSLTGSLPKKTMRRYGGSILNDRHRHESGLRLLIGFIAKRAAGLDKAITPVISFWNSHYYRVIVKVRSGAYIADDMLELVSTYNKKRNLMDFYEDIDEGPMWKGDLSSFDTKSNINEPYIQEDAKDLLKTLSYENTMLMFYDLGDMASHLHENIPRMNMIMELLMDEFNVEPVRTRFSQTGVKYRGPNEYIMNAFSKLSLKK